MPDTFLGMWSALVTIGWFLAAENPLVELGAYNGNVRVVVTGNTMATPYTPNPGNVPPDPNLPDGLGCLLPSNTATTPALSLSGRAQLLKAYLYFTGNYFQKGASPPPLSTDVRNLVDRAVSLRLPGATESTTVVANVADVHIASFTDGLLSPQRTSYFFSARADITALLLTQPQFLGTYTLSEFSTLICPDGEVACVPDATVQPQCASPYYVATASFVIVLVIADPAFTPRSLRLFDGLEILNGDNPEKHLTLSGFTVPSIPRGEVSLYTVEGDVHLFGDSVAVNAGRGEVPLGQVVDPAPLSPISCGDASLPNWQNNVMDSSLVLDPLNPLVSTCVRGVDIDTFDISSVLQANDTSLDLAVRSVGTPRDTFALGFAALGVDTFQPILNADSRKEVLKVPTGGAEPQTKLTYRIGLSNTGNIRATGVRVTDDLPGNISELKVLKIPAGATDSSVTTGGLNRTGRIVVDGISVEPGEVEEIRYEVTITCPVGDRTLLENSAVVSASAEGALGVFLGSIPVTVTDPNGDICAGRKQPNTPLVPNTLPLNRTLRGGAGCGATSAPSALWVLIITLAIAVRCAKRVSLRSVVVVVALFAGDCTCTRQVPADPTPSVSGPSVPPQPPVYPGVACVGHPEMVLLQTGGACIDRFEQVVESGSAREGYGEVPSGGFDHATATAICARDDKRLCTAAEWERGCRGVGARLYPYGDSFDGKKCNGFDADWAEVLPSGAMADCVSDVGVYDMSGNLAEWIEADAPLVGGTGKQLRGGSFVGNLSGMACSSVTPRDPASVDVKVGVRCCLTP